MTNPYHGKPPSQRHSPTSREAADQIESQLNKLQQEVLSFLQGRGEYGATDEEIQKALDMAQNTERPRRRELQLKDLVCDSGHKRLTSSGRRAVVWVYKTSFSLEFSP